MTLATTLNRIAEIQTMVDPGAAARAAAARQAALVGTATPVVNDAGRATFAKALQGAEAVGGGGQGSTDMVAAARTQHGVVEQPPGSNDSPEIKTYRDAVAGAPGPGPWCAYFVSWAAKETGTPLGDNGQGFGSVDQMWAWAQGAGKATPNGPGVKPKVGDIIILNQHTGIVTGVKPDGTVETIEGNTSDKVAERTHPAGAAIGYISVR
ncbi:CHAP domain-containing protein [Patulibacter americanus]|uniref:CHAP domain-containing protein n=1 Tax=Patulibacter americanus TaxID=588672 RepID=UPI0003B46687|nr:CHAP domain-containing protein [Patulibacter americanus]